ncbi:uncharacterized protein LOC134281891 isoform X2 [Saccostrea cucullata]
MNKQLNSGISLNKINNQQELGIPGSPHSSKESAPQKEESIHTNYDSTDEIIGPFDMEKGALSTPPFLPIELEESELDKKLLGLPGWEYVMVSLVVVAAVGVGGSVAIVCKKCCGLAGRKANNKAENC